MQIPKSKYVQKLYPTHPKSHRSFHIPATPKLVAVLQTFKDMNTLISNLDRGSQMTNLVLIKHYSMFPLQKGLQHLTYMFFGSSTVKNGLRVIKKENKSPLPSYYTLWK